MNGEVFACGPTAGSASCTIPLPEGTGTVNYLATSAQGTTAGGAKNWQRDVTLPGIDGTLNATAGANGWFISPAEVSASVTETGSGLGMFETSLDNTNWTAYTAPLTFNDGVYTLNLRATDIAGNIATADLAFNIDTLPPSVDGTLVGRLGSANWYISAVQASAAPADATSGVAFTEYSTDGGASWQPYAAPVNFNDGRHSIQFKTTDVAGLSALSPVYTFKADASAPHINLPSRWYIWESITFDLEEEMSGFADIEMQIMDSQGRWKKVEQHWQSDQSSFAHTLFWDRQFADGVLAPIGNYPVLVRAWDKAGNMSEKTGQIIIPQPEVAPLPTFTRTPTAAPEVVATETEPPIKIEEAAETAIPEPAPAEDEKQPKARIVTFGSKSNTPTPPASRSPNSQSPILWGAAASAAIGAFNAAIAERKRRERAEHLRQLKNWEGNQSDYMRKRGAQKAVIAAWREKQKKKQAQKKKRLALQEKILGIKEKILDPIVPPPPNPYAGAADRIRAAANEIDDEKKIGYRDPELPPPPKIVPYTSGSLIPTTSTPPRRLYSPPPPFGPPYPYRGIWYDVDSHSFKGGNEGLMDIIGIPQLGQTPRIKYPTSTFSLLDAVGVRGEFTFWSPVGGLDINFDLVYFNNSNQVRLFFTPGGQAGVGAGIDGTAGFLFGRNMPDASSYTGGSMSAGGDLSLGVGLEGDISTSLLPNSDGSFPTVTYIGGGAIAGEGGYTNTSITFDIYEEITKLTQRR